MSEPETSSEWTVKEVLDKLRTQTKPGAAAKLHVFLKDGVAPDRLETVARDMLSAAKVKTGAVEAALGSIHRLARSFSVEADLPTLEALASNKDVRAILPSEVEDVYPKPVRRGETEN